MRLSILLSAFALGLVLASSPGPVQAVLIAESARGGRRRGFAAKLGANATFAVLLVALAGGLAVVAPTGTAARLIRLGGGIFLLLLAADTWRGARRQRADAEVMAPPKGLPPASESRNRLSALGSAHAANVLAVALAVFGLIFIAAAVAG